MKRLLTIVCACICLMQVFTIHAQDYNPDIFIPDNTKSYSVETVDGKQYYPDSMFVTIKELELVVNTIHISIPKKNIKSITLISELGNPKDLLSFTEKTNHLSSRYFVNSSAFPVPKGEFQLHNVYLFFNTLNYGVSDNVSIGIGFELLTTFLGGIFKEKTLPTITISPKYSLPIGNNLYGAVGGLFSYSKWTGIGGIGYGSLSYGNQYHNITGSVYSGILDINDENIKGPMFFSISGMSRISKHFYILTENYIFPSSNNSSLLNMIGGRILWEYFSFDGGLAGFSQPYFALGIRM